MESFGIPCVHILHLLIYLQIKELPESLVLKRWTMKAKEAHVRLERQRSLVGDRTYESRITAMNDELQGLTFAAYGNLGDFKDVMEWVRNKKAELLGKHGHNREGSSNIAAEKSKTQYEAATKPREKKQKRKVRCSKCNGIGHNRRNYRRDDGTIKWNVEMKIMKMMMSGLVKAARRGLIKWSIAGDSVWDKAQISGTPCILWHNWYYVGYYGN
ncbi:hypothetical protein PIB30_013086 [Stylosanthes scabra]|uniref:Protein FAR1-RELATED SEQUENCE n=1 Tax=Stylosanthes scabra TaxID=79078 RepID=A0ABU6U6K8_9FABA|nr:hypothetical protein [Stylosanthes scabra]